MGLDKFHKNRINKVILGCPEPSGNYQLRGAKLGGKKEET